LKKDEIMTIRHTKKWRQALNKYAELQQTTATGALIATSTAAMMKNKVTRKILEGEK